MKTQQITKLASRLGSGNLLRQAHRAGRRAAKAPAVARQRPEGAKAKLTERLPVAVAGAVLSTGAGGGAAWAADGGASVDAAVGSVVDAVRAAGEVAKAGLGAVETGSSYARQAYNAVAPVVKAAADAAAPVVREGVEAGSKLAGEVVVPAVKGAAPVLERALTSTGVDPQAVKAVAQTTEAAAAATAPLLDRAATFLTTSDPATLGGAALALLAAYYAAPPLLRAAADAFRGYAGDVSPAGALDAVTTQRDALLVDIRTPREKEAGSPDLPNGGRLIELEYASIGDSRVRSLLRDAPALEAQVTALQIAALKRVSKGSRLLLLGGGGGGAKAVARELARRGYGRVFVVSGGYQGWVSARLRTKAPAVVTARVEVLPPGSVRQSGPSRQLAAGAIDVTGRPAGSTKQQAKAIPPQPARRALPARSSASQ